MKIALRAPSGFLSAENGGDNAGIVHVNRPQVGAWETLTVTPLEDRVIALRTVNDRYLSAEGGGGGEIHA